MFETTAIEPIKQKFLGSNWNYSFSVARAAACAPAENQKLPVANTFSAPDLQASDPTSAESAYPFAMAFLKITWYDSCGVSWDSIDFYTWINLLKLFLIHCMTGRERAMRNGAFSKFKINFGGQICIRFSRKWFSISMSN